MQPRFLYLLLAPFLFLCCQGQPSGSVQTIDTKSFAEKLKADKNPQLLDVRTPEEFSSGHIDNAANVNWNGNDFASKAEKLDRSKPVFVYCKVGGRSAQAANKLAEMGFTKVYNLEGGIMKWDAAGSTKSSDTIIGICDQEYGELVKSSDRVLIDFNAKWCEPCKRMKPYLSKMQTEMKEKIKIIQLDADENKTIVEQLKLDGLPVII